DRVHDKAELSAKGDLAVTAKKDVASEGGNFKAGGDVTIGAGEAVILSALPVARYRQDRLAGGHSTASKVTHETNEVKAGDDVGVKAGTDLTLRGAKVEAGDDATLAANDNVELASVQDSETSDLKIDIKTKGLF